MRVFLTVLLLFLIFVHKGTPFTFEKYKETLVNTNDDCNKIFNSLDISTQLKFFDATAKIPPGILGGNFIMYGAYDDCLAIDVPMKDVIGKYCTANIASTYLVNFFSDNGYLLNASLIDNLHVANDITQLLRRILPVRKIDQEFNLFSFKVGICIPHRCGNESLQIKLDESLCRTRKTNSELSTRSIVTLYIIIGIFIVAVISTIYDIIRVHYDRDPHHDVLIAFSFYSNGKKLCKSSKNPDQLLCINGLKTLNIMWVITGHTFGAFMEGPIDNFVEVISWNHDYSSMFLVGATVSVDSFFTIGGLLSVYNLLRSKDLGVISSIKSIPMLYLHRYLRLTPALAIIILIYWSSLNNYIADGPYWDIMDTESENCKQSWWAALLYIQNYRTSVQECIGPSWYLSVDMQLFILSPLIWIPLRQWPKLTMKVLFGLVVLGIAIPFGISFYYKLPATLIGNPGNNFMNVYYMKTHTRFGTYVIGMIAGYYIYHAKLRKQRHINPVALVWLWSLIIIVLYGCIYVGYPLVTKEAPSLNGIPNDVDEATRWWNSIYLALIRPAWSTSVAVLIYLCVIGYGGPVNWFLSVGPMQFLAKLSYCMYLNHILFINLRVGQTRTTIHFGIYELINIVISVIMTIIPASILHSLLFESPMICIEKIIFGKRNTSSRDGNSLKNGV